MRIGILTLPQETNYGGILQAFALQRVLRDMGHEVLTIDRHNRRGYPSFSAHLAGYTKRLLLHYLAGKKTITTKWNPHVTAEDYAKASAETQRFIDQNIKLTRKVFSDELDAIEKEYSFDAYVVGSDQIWLDYYCPESFLSFVHRPEARRVVYAASCGRASFFNNEAKVQQCCELVKQFDGVSVRENYLVALCKERLGIDAQWVLDPTMLLRPNDYMAVSENKVGSKPIVFSYVLDAEKDKERLVETVARVKGCPIVNGNRVMTVCTDVSKAFPSVEDWIWNINRSSFVVTDSFHGTVFSILFNKPFISIGNKKRGTARFQSLLSMFGLENRLLTSYDEDIILDLIHRPIDFTEVNRTIDLERRKSIQFLTETLAI